MFLRSFRVLLVSGILAIAGSASTAFGQCWPFNACCCCPQPVRVTACYRTVPVTELREVRHRRSMTHCLSATDRCARARAHARARAALPF